MRKKELSREEMSQEDLEELERREDAEKWAEIDRQWLASLKPSLRAAVLQQRERESRMQQESYQRWSEETGVSFDVQDGKIVSVEFPFEIEKKKTRKGKGKR